MTVATAGDVSVAIGRSLTAAEITQAEWWLTGIELVIRGRLGDLAALDQDVLLYVEAEAVAEKLRRAGRSESSITVSVDDGSVTRRYENPITSGDITDEWWNLLDPSSGSGGMHSVRPSFDADTVQWAVSTPPSPYMDPTWTLL